MLPTPTIRRHPLLSPSPPASPAPHPVHPSPGAPHVPRLAAIRPWHEPTLAGSASLLRRPSFRPPTPSPPTRTPSTPRSLSLGTESHQSARRRVSPSVPGRL